MIRKLAYLVAASALLAGCAAPDMTAAGEPEPDKVYRTGSNIPERDRQGVRTLSPEEIERMKAATSGTLIKDPMRRP
jgi:hypothetical protein